MHIDSKAERLVREALDAVVKRDVARFADALVALSGPEVATAGYRLAASVVFAVLQEQYRGQPPAEEIRAVAEEVADAENWTDLTADEIETFLATYYAGATVDTVMPIERAVLVAYVLAANLLASYHNDGEWWFNYLDRVELALETAP
ncbi:hypothetical protein Aph02nite_65270 [Actinoplanes philippinensis]|uniref:Uncharacterized protein n=1 Tax=Actinoplanes philippinensis TaxID=35752 RepID=A0A1I2LBY0_9ACTN|nr:hypothetical protein [Actinoplanes philippinensis]GIE80577.1 hypothetical protein Aph02nite_65270 [Actinoplanes philippinensis]SFF76902.1 hypothetical protein SAMN05421541_12148 [Actinoplanes philippinensis]